MIEIGIDSFATAIAPPSSGVDVQSDHLLGNLLSQVELADQVGIDVFGVGEHHRREFLDSAPAVILGAAAARTRRIRLTSAVTVLSAADPVRVFQQFATLDLLSHGRTFKTVCGSQPVTLAVPRTPKPSANSLTIWTTLACSRRTPSTG